jgi:hypothetical protein
LLKNNSNNHLYNKELLRSIGDLMSKFNIDYSSLTNQITKKAYKLSDVKDQLESIGFDVVRFKDSDKSADLWQVQSADDGEYIVALYETDKEVKSAKLWDVSISKLAGSIDVSYKGDPIVRVNASRLGVPSSEVNKIPEYLPAKLAANPKLVKALLNELSDSAKQEVLTKYPELS